MRPISSTRSSDNQVGALEGRRDGECIARNGRFEPKTFEHFFNFFVRKIRTKNVIYLRERDRDCRRGLRPRRIFVDDANDFPPAMSVMSASTSRMPYAASSGEGRFWNRTLASVKSLSACAPRRTVVPSKFADSMTRSVVVPVTSADFPPLIPAMPMALFEFASVMTRMFELSVNSSFESVVNFSSVFALRTPIAYDPFVCVSFPHQRRGAAGRYSASRSWSRRRHY